MFRDLQKKLSLGKKSYACNHHVMQKKERKDGEKLAKGRSNEKAAGNVLVYLVGFAQVNLFL